MKSSSRNFIMCATYCNITKDTNGVNENTLYSQLDTIITELESYNRILNKLELRGNRSLETRANAYYYTYLISLTVSNPENLFKFLISELLCNTA